MRVVEDAALAILEDAEEQPETHGDVGDVRDGDEETTAGGERLAHATQQRGGVAEMLEDVGEDDGADVRRQRANPLQVGDDHAVETAVQVADAVDLVFEADGAVEVVAHRCPQLAAGRAEVEQQPAVWGASNQADEDPVAAALEVLECIDVRHSSVARVGSPRAVASRGLAVYVDHLRLRRRGGVVRKVIIAHRLLGVLVAGEEALGEADNRDALAIGLLQALHDLAEVAVIGGELLQYRR